MFSGSVEGENVTLTPFSEEAGEAVIVWKWRFNTWQPGQFSKVCRAVAIWSVSEQRQSNDSATAEERQRGGRVTTARRQSNDSATAE